MCSIVAGHVSPVGEPTRGQHRLRVLPKIKKQVQDIRWLVNQPPLYPLLLLPRSCMPPGRCYKL